MSLRQVPLRPVCLQGRRSGLQPQISIQEGVHPRSQHNLRCCLSNLSCLFSHTSYGRGVRKEGILSWKYDRSQPKACSSAVVGRLNSDTDRPGRELVSTSRRSNSSISRDTASSNSAGEVLVKHKFLKQPYRATTKSHEAVSWKRTQADADHAPSHVVLSGTLSKPGTQQLTIPPRSPSKETHLLESGTTRASPSSPLDAQFSHSSLRSLRQGSRKANRASTGPLPVPFAAFFKPHRNSSAPPVHRRSRRKTSTLKLPPLWEKKYASLNSLYNRGTPERLQKNFAYDRKQAEDILANIKLHDLDESLKAQPRNYSKFALAKLLIGSLAASAGQILSVLSHLSPFVDDYVVRMQCLQFVYSAHQEDLRADSNLQQQFRDEIAKQMLPEKWPKDRMTATQFHLLLKDASDAQSKLMIHSYLQGDYGRSPDIKLRIVGHLIQKKQIDEAVKVLCDLPPLLLQQPAEFLLSLCSQLIRHDTVIQTSAGPNFQYLPMLLEKGLRPDALLHTKIMEKAIEAGYPNVAWDLYRFLESVGDRILPKAYLILLKHSFISKNFEGVNEMMSVIHSRQDLYTDPRIVAYSMNMVRLLCYFERRATTEEALEHILTIYDKVYSRTPLIRLGVMKSDVPYLDDGGLPEPSPVLVGYTLWSYILCHHHNRPVDELWHRLVDLAVDDDSTALSVLRHDVIYNAFISFYSRTKASLPKARAVVDFMVEKRYSLPTSQTWSLLVCSFLKYNQVHEAQEAMRLMESNGIKITSIGKDYIPEGYTLEDLVAQKDHVLDERMMDADPNTEAQEQRLEM